MDLPTTDPGSDLCDLTDSADESFVKSEGREYGGIYIYQSNNISILIIIVLYIDVYAFVLIL